MNVGVYFDLSDLYHRVNRRFGRKLNYGAVLESFKFFGNISRSCAYGIQMTNEASSFIACLERVGIYARFKRPEIIRCGDREIKRANWEAQMALDIVRDIEASELGIVILGSGSARMVPLVEYVRERGVKCLAFGVGIEKELKKVVDGVIDVNPDALE
jgi:uncharacterized LabA/DUF88 family protein